MNGLKGKFKGGTGSYEKCGFICSEIQTSINNIKKIAEYSITETPDISEVLHTAIDVENSFYEKEFFSSFEANKALVVCLLYSQ